MNKNIFKLAILFLLLLNNPIFAAKKKDAINKEDNLIAQADMSTAGSWKLYMDKCGGKKHTKFLKDLAKLSWPDYKAYMASAAKYTSGGFYSDNCKAKDTDAVIGFYDLIISELTYLTGSTESFNNESNENSNNNDFAEVDSLTDIEKKLEKLKELFDKELISIDDYEEKKQAILDSF